MATDLSRVKLTRTAAQDKVGETKTLVQQEWTPNRQGNEGLIPTYMANTDTKKENEAS